LVKTLFILLDRVHNSLKVNKLTTYAI